MKIIGLTGGSGSGKSTVASLLAAYHMAVIDADRIGHEVIQKGKPAYIELISYFGEDILDPEGNILRKQLGRIAFADPEKLQVLTRCTHTYIIQEIKERISAIQGKPATYTGIVIDAPLLIEAGLHLIVDEVWVVYAERDTRIQRIMKRDQISREQAEARIYSQMSWEELKKYATIVLDNEKGLEYLKEQIERLLSVCH